MLPHGTFMFGALIVMIGPHLITNITFFSMLGSFRSSSFHLWKTKTHFANCSIIKWCGIQLDDTHFIFNYLNRMFWTKDLLILTVDLSSPTIRERSSIMMASIIFTIISMLDVFDEPFLGNADSKILPMAKNMCQGNIIA